MVYIKILMVHPHDIYSENEPWTIRIISLAHEFTKKGHEVKLVYFPLGKSHRGKLRIPKIKEYETIPFVRSQRYFLRNIKRMVKLGKWADVIHFQKCFPNAAIPALFSAYLNKKPIHYDWDDWEYGIYMWKPESILYSKYLNILEKTIPKLVDSVSVASEELRMMAQSLGIKNKTIIKVNVCADINKFKPSNKKELIKKKYSLNTKTVLYLGQLHGAQYAEQLINAIPLIIKSISDVKFLLVGGGTELSRLKVLSKNLGVYNSVIFTGFVNSDKVTEYLAVSDVAVACFADTKQVKCKSPLKIAEYMASGKAIVASNTGEVPWMLGNAGILAEPGNIDDLAKQIISLLTNDKKVKVLEKAARKRAEEHFSWTIVSDRLLSKYSEIAGLSY